VLAETDDVVVGSVTVLARLFGPGHRREVDRRPGNTTGSTCTVIIEAPNISKRCLLLPQNEKNESVELIVEVEMQNDTLELDKMQSAYKAAVEEWIAAIKQEEALASVNHSVAEVDKWEGAHFREDDIRSKVKAAKKQYEDALRKKFYHF
jgi:hypothetical protein